ncbi:hypothetical protein BDR04DRAFT_1123269 [Suillus decipiens]|nr:hypothetical protein BDR04DRAFT_1123269 [Suillus decipiens]
MPVVTQTAHVNSHVPAPAASLSQYETESLDAKYMIKESASDEDLTDTESITDTDESQTEQKFYVVRVGHRPVLPSVHKSLSRIKAARQIDNFPGARLVSYHTKQEAVADYRGFKCGRAISCAS